MVLIKRYISTGVGNRPKGKDGMASKGKSEKGEGNGGMSAPKGKPTTRVYDVHNLG